MSFFDGSAPPPATTSPKYVDWYEKDQILLSLFVLFLSQLFLILLGYNHQEKPGVCLQNIFV